MRYINQDMLKTVLLLNTWIPYN